MALKILKYHPYSQLQLGKGQNPSIGKNGSFPRKERLLPVERTVPSKGKPRSFPKNVHSHPHKPLFCHCDDVARKHRLQKSINIK